MKTEFKSAMELPVIKKMPSPLKKPDGTFVKDLNEWLSQREYLKEMVQHYMYGKWPGIDHKVTGKADKVQHFMDNIVRENLTLTVDGSFSYSAVLTYRQDLVPQPTFIYNCSGKDMGCRAELELLSEGYALCCFDREQIVADATITPVDSTHVYANPGCCDIMAWGWGCSLTANYLLERKIASTLMVTGHSRGGKAALAAGIFDERFEICAPMGSGCGGLGCSRFTGTLKGDRQDETMCETVGRITASFPNWFDKNFAEFGSKEGTHPITELEEHLPFDCNTLRALIAPRAAFNSEGENDLWTNTLGTQLSYQGAAKVYDFLGIGEKNGYFIREGVHSFSYEDWLGLITFANRVLGKKEPSFAVELNNVPFQLNIDDYAE